MTGLSEDLGKIVFVGGAQRGGTTLLQRILCSTPATNPLIAECRYLFSVMLQYDETLRHFDLRGRDYFGSPEALAEFTRDTCRRFLLATRAKYPRAETLVLKSPELTRFFPVFGRWFPTFRFVVILRDPRDAIASMVAVSEKARDEGRRSQIADLGRDMARYCGAFNASYAPLAQDKEGMAERLLLLRYEDLVRDPGAIAALARFTDLALSPEAAALPARADDLPSLDVRKTSKSSAEFYSPLWSEGATDSRIGAFRDRLTSTEIAEIERFCADFSRAFGYW